MSRQISRFVSTALGRLVPARRASTASCEYEYEETDENYLFSVHYHAGENYRLRVPSYSEHSDGDSLFYKAGWDVIEKKNWHKAIDAMRNKEIKFIFYHQPESNTQHEHVEPFYDLMKSIKSCHIMEYSQSEGQIHPLTEESIKIIKPSIIRFGENCSTSWVLKSGVLQKECLKDSRISFLWRENIDLQCGKLIDIIGNLRNISFQFEKAVNCIDEFRLIKEYLKEWKTSSCNPNLEHLSLSFHPSDKVADPTEVVSSIDKSLVLNEQYATAYKKHIPHCWRSSYGSILTNIKKGHDAKLELTISDPGRGFPFNQGWINFKIDIL